MPKNIFFIITLMIVSTGGCAHITEPFKVILGSSTRALEKARTDALTKTYKCSFKECFDAVLALVYTDDSWNEPVEENVEDKEEGEEEEKKIFNPQTPELFKTALIGFR